MAGVLVLIAAEFLENLAGLLMVGAAAALAGFTRDLFKRLPWPLYLAAEATYDAVVGTIFALVGWSEAAAHNLAQAWAGIFINPRINIGTISAALGDTAAALRVLRVVTIPYYAALSEAYAFSQVGQEAAARLAGDNALFWTAYNWVQGLYQFTTQALAALGATVELRFGQAVAYTQAVAQALLGELQQGLGAEAAARQAADAAGVAFTESVGAAAIAYTQQVGQALEGELRQEDALLRGLIDAGDVAAAGYAQQLAAIVAAFAAARANANALAIQAIEDSPCQQVCQPLGQLGQAVQELQQLATVELLLQLAVQGVRDPQGAAREVSGLFGPLVASTAQDVRAQVGV